MMGAAATAGRFADLRKRAVSAAVLGPLVVACIWLGAGPWTAMVALGAAVLTWEWVHLCGHRTRALPGAFVPIVVFAAGALAIVDRPLLGLLALGPGYLLAWWGARRGVRGIARPWELAAGVVYVGLAAISLIELRDTTEAGRANVLFLFVVVWASDIGAYAAGRLVGGPKLAPAVSPSKTWSGAAGGLGLAVLAGVMAAAALAPGGALAAALVAALLSVVAQAGDLFESAIKRHFGVKDSSALIPGHGGLFDRMDGVLAAAPVAVLLHYADPGAPLWL
jgi:phosphatidate cytidylyltransferase